MEQQPLDINKVIGIDDFNKDNTTVIYESNPSKLPEEFKDFPREIEPDIDTPIPFHKKTHNVSKNTLKKGVAYRNSFKKLKRYKNL